MKSTELPARRCETRSAMRRRKRSRRKLPMEIPTSGCGCATTEVESTQELPIEALAPDTGACRGCANVQRLWREARSLERTGSRDGNRVDRSCRRCVWQIRYAPQILVL